MLHCFCLSLETQCASAATEWMLARGAIGLIMIGYMGPIMLSVMRDEIGLLDTLDRITEDCLLPLVTIRAVTAYVPVFGKQ
jgi:hypothetical protein